MPEENQPAQATFEYTGPQGAISIKGDKQFVTQCNQALLGIINQAAQAALNEGKPATFAIS